MAGTLLFQIKRINAQSGETDPRITALLEKSQASNIWYEKELFPEVYYEAFFELLSKFELIHWMESYSKYLVPSGLSDSKLGNAVATKLHLLADGKTKSRKLEFSRFFPIGLFHRLIVKILQFYSNEKFSNYAIWKSGIILGWENGSIEFEQSDLFIHITSKSTENSWIDTKMLDLVQIAIKMITENFPGEYCYKVTTN